MRLYSIFAQTRQEGIKCIKVKEYLRAYCPNIYTVDFFQPYMQDWAHYILAIFYMAESIFRQFQIRCMNFNNFEVEKNCPLNNAWPGPANDVALSQIK